MVEASKCYGSTSLEHPAGGQLACIGLFQLCSARTHPPPPVASLLLPTNKRHFFPYLPPPVSMVATERGRFYLGGKVTGFELPKR